MADQQGHLDSLCGIYVVINAVNLVYPMPKHERVCLFEYLIHTLHKDKSAINALLYGTYKRHITLLLGAASRYLKRHYRITLGIEMLFERCEGIDTAFYCQTLQQFLQQDNRAVIINLMGRLNHWSCVRDITDTSLLLEDSCGYRYVRKQSCHIGHEYLGKGHLIIPTQTWGIGLKH